MLLFAVVASTGGAYEAECVYSIWSTEPLARAEIDRLAANDVSAGCNAGDFYVVPVTLDAPSDTWIG